MSSIESFVDKLILFPILSIDNLPILLGLFIIFPVLLLNTTLERIIGEDSNGFEGELGVSSGFEGTYLFLV